MAAGLAPLAGCAGSESEAPAGPAAELRQGEDRVEILLDGKPFSAFHSSDKWDKPFLHPLATPSGVVVTRGFPVADLPGESQDHPWHRGIIWGHGLINGQDFWREQGRDKTSRFVVEGEVVTGVSNGRALLECSCALTPPDGESIGACHQSFRIQSTPDGNLIDAWITVTAGRGQDLVFGDTEDGGFGFRFHDAFRQDRWARLLNSDGLLGSENIWGKRARWVQYSTDVDGRPASVTMFDHPSNFRHPTYWHARDYGLCAANPFGLHDFLGDPAQDGSHTVEKGGQFVLRYRVLIADGVTPAADVERIFSAFSA